MDYMGCIRTRRCNIEGFRGRVGGIRSWSI